MANRNEIYTPIEYVKVMLDEIGYKTYKNISSNHIIDNSSGNGAFLKEIVKRYIFFSKKRKKNKQEIILELEKYIHGIDISQKAVNETLKNLNEIVNKELKIKKNNIKWDIFVSDTTKIDTYNGKMDYVVGNPPYVRVHNIDKSINYKKFVFTKNGMADLYIVFFEIGIKMLNSRGQLIYITPNSYFTTKNAKVFREYIIKENILKKIINFEHKLIFDKVQTYTSITHLSKQKKDEKIEYIMYNSKSKTVFLNKNSIVFGSENCFIFSEIDDDINKIINIKDLNKNIIVKNGFATNANDVFIGKFDKNNSPLLIPALKIRRVDEKKCFIREKAIFPYFNKEKLELTKIKYFDEFVYSYLIENKNVLLNRKIDKNQNWWEYSKTQGIRDLDKEKIVISNVFKNTKQIYTELVEKNTLVYGSGYYVCSLSENLQLDYVNKLFFDKKDLFMNYLKVLNKNKGSQYYFYTSKDFHKFLTYVLQEWERTYKYDE